MIENAQSRSWIENKDEKHNKEASGSWYRYDVAFTIPVDDARTVRKNAYQAIAVVRIKKDKLYLYDIINIKKKRVRRFSPKIVR